MLFDVSLDGDDGDGEEVTGDVIVMLLVAICVDFISTSSGASILMLIFSILSDDLL